MKTNSVKNRTRTDQDVLLIRAALRSQFPTAEVKRENSISIRVRIVDSRFRRLSLGERDDLVMPLLKAVPQRVMDDITVLLLLTPEEKRHSISSEYFDHPKGLLVQ